MTRDKRSYIIGARGSELSKRQADSVLKRLKECFPDKLFKFRIISTRGDRDLHSPLSEIGGQGVFVKEIEAVLADGGIDMAVHSAKDLPSKLPPGLILAAVPERGSVEDAFCSIKWNCLEEMPVDAVIAAGSPRRQAFVRRLRPDAKIIGLRGNIETRYNRMIEGYCDAIIIAKAALERMGLQSRITQVLAPEVFLPAPGQGALAVEIREDDEEIYKLAVSINSPVDFACVQAERAMMRRLNAGCSAPVGAWARLAGGIMKLNAVIMDSEGDKIINTAQETDSIDEAERLGILAAEDMLNKGAEELLRNDR
ncbi:MAG: hydroxymethylbilane synthase [FCB group bacterium]|nr:hydroxymethylbilane synthase [FCB group bacterium]